MEEYNLLITVIIILTAILSVDTPLIISNFIRSRKNRKMLNELNKKDVTKTGTNSKN